MENQEQQEIWRTTDYYPGYTFSNKGRVYSYRSNPNRFLKGSKSKGYIRVGILDYNNEKQQPYLSRIIYMLFGDDPELLPYKQVDHINNKEKTNNNIKNLRLADPRENNINKRKRSTHAGNTPSSPYIGLTWNKKNQKWQASIQVMDKPFHLGLYKHPENGVIAYQRVAHHFKPPDFWNNTLPDGFQAPIFETEGRYRKSEKAFHKITNYLDNNA